MVNGRASLQHSNGRGSLSRSATRNAQGNEPYRASFTALLVILLLIPEKNIYINYGLITAVTLLFVWLGGVRPRKNAYFKVVGALIVFVIAAAGLRWLIVFEMNLRDYTEAFRLLPSALIFVSMRRWKGIQFSNFVDAACVFLVIDGFVSYLQLQGTNTLGLLGIARTYYNYELHYEVSLLGSDRVLGLLPGPGQHGVVLLMLVTVTLLGVFRSSSVRRRVTAAGGFLIATLTIVITQSQTNFIAASAIISLMLFLFLAAGSTRSRVVASALVGLLAFAGINLLLEYAGDLKYLFTLFEQGLERSSYQAREVKWTRLLGAAADFPYLMPIGWGKSFFGEASTAMDNEYLYLLLVYGVPLFALYLIALLRYVLRVGFRLLRGKEEGNLTMLLFYMLCGGMVVAWPASFVLEPKVALLLSLVLAGRFWEKRRQQRRRQQLGGQEVYAIAVK